MPELPSARGIPQAGTASSANGQNSGLVKYNSDFADLQKKGQLVPSVTPGGRAVTDHAANRILNGGPGREPMSITDVDKVLDKADVIKKVNMGHPKGATITAQNTRMAGKPQVTVDAKTGKTIVTVIQPKAK